ncbi:hypothetical protein ACS0PU_003114 [Formica fusca]
MWKTMLRTSKVVYKTSIRILSGDSRLYKIGKHQTREKKQLQLAKQQSKEIGLLKNEIQEMKKEMKEQHNILRILYIGQLATNVKLFIQLEIISKKIGKISSLDDYNKLVEEG